MDSETTLSGVHTPKQTFLLKQPSHFPGALGVSPTDFASPTWRDLSWSIGDLDEVKQGFSDSDPGIGDEVTGSFSLGFMKQLGFGGRDTENRKCLHTHRYVDITHLKRGKESGRCRVGSGHLSTWNTGQWQDTQPRVQSLGLNSSSTENCPVPLGQALSCPTLISYPYTMSTDLFGPPQADIS